MQAAEHPSPSAVSPSSQPSAASTTPSPHTAGAQPGLLSTMPSQLSSRPLHSSGAPGFTVPSLSSQSSGGEKPSASASGPHPGTAVWSHVPAAQVSTEQSSPSSHCASLRQPTRLQLDG